MRAAWHHPVRNRRESREDEQIQVPFTTPAGGSLSGDDYATMSSYQDGSNEIESLLTGERVEQEQPARKTGLEFAKYIVVFCLAGMVLLVNVSLTGTEKQSSNMSVRV